MNTKTAKRLRKSIGYHPSEPTTYRTVEYRNATKGYMTTRWLVAKDTIRAKYLELKQSYLKGDIK